MRYRLPRAPQVEQYATADRRERTLLLADFAITRRRARQALRTLRLVARALVPPPAEGVLAQGAGRRARHRRLARGGAACSEGARAPARARQPRRRFMAARGRGVAARGRGPARARAGHPVRFWVCRARRGADGVHGGLRARGPAVRAHCGVRDPPLLEASGTSACAGAPRRGRRLLPRRLQAPARPRRAAGVHRDGAQLFAAVLALQPRAATLGPTAGRATCSRPRSPSARGVRRRARVPARRHAALERVVAFARARATRARCAAFARGAQERGRRGREALPARWSRPRLGVLGEIAEENIAPTPAERGPRQPRARGRAAGRSRRRRHGHRDVAAYRADARALQRCREAPLYHEGFVGEFVARALRGGPARAARSSPPPRPRPRPRPQPRPPARPAGRERRPAAARAARRLRAGRRARARGALRREPRRARDRARARRRVRAALNRTLRSGAAWPAGPSRAAPPGTLARLGGRSLSRARGAPRRRVRGGAGPEFDPRGRPLRCAAELGPTRGRARQRELGRRFAASVVAAVGYTRDAESGGAAAAPDAVAPGGARARVEASPNTTSARAAAAAAWRAGWSRGRRARRRLAPPRHATAARARRWRRPRA